MAGETIVFFPKYTTLMGNPAPSSNPYYSDPFEVVGYKQVNVEFFVGGGSGDGVLTGQLQESSDLITWSSITGTSAPNRNAIGTLTATNPARYIRLKLTFTAATDNATIWAKAVARDS